MLIAAVLHQGWLLVTLLTWQPRLACQTIRWWVWQCCTSTWPPSWSLCPGPMVENNTWSTSDFAFDPKTWPPNDSQLPWASLTSPQELLCVSVDCHWHRQGWKNDLDRVRTIVWLPLGRNQLGSAAGPEQEWPDGGNCPWRTLGCSHQAWRDFQVLGYLINIPSLPVVQEDYKTQQPAPSVQCLGLWWVWHAG